MIGLKLQSSGDKYFFWLQDPKIQAADLVSQLNALLSEETFETRSPKIPKFDGNLISNLFKSKPTPFRASQVLTTDAIMDSCDADFINYHLSQFFPEGYQATKADLRSLVTSPYFSQAVDALDQIMASEDAPTFLAQFGLLEHYDGTELGFSALIKALRKKKSKE